MNQQPRRNPVVDSVPLLGWTQDRGQAARFRLADGSTSRRCTWTPSKQAAIAPVDMEHLENDPIGPRYALRVERLRQWHVVRVTCDMCQHVGAIEAQVLIRKWPPYIRLVDLARRFRCERCGNRAGNRWEVCRMKRD